MKIERINDLAAILELFYPIYPQAKVGRLEVISIDSRM